jgi:integrase
VAEWFRRQPAELLYMGSIPIPSSIDKPLDSSIAMFLWQLKKEGYKETTIKQSYAKILKHLSNNCSIKNSDSVLTYIADKHISNGRKEIMVDVYANYCKFLKIPFTKPRYKRQDCLPHVPLEKDIEALISALPRKVSIMTRCIYETGARCGEVFALKWKDIDFQNCSININAPEKGSKARRLKVSAQLIGLISSLQRRCEYIFRISPVARIESIETYFLRERKKIANNLCNPSIGDINWKSLRHYRATMEYHKTKDILHVMNILGHKSISNTLVYTHLVNFDNDEFICKTATSVEEAINLIEHGFEYVTEMDSVKIFRKRK